MTERTPHCTKIRYGITGAPLLTEDEMDGSHAPGVGVAPTLVELVYSPARDGKPARVDASVTGDWTRFGEPDGFGGRVTTHFKNGPDGWPAWLAEEARLHDPAAKAERLREKHKASLRRADEINNELMEEVQRYAEGSERPVLWSVYNRMHLRAITAEAELEKLRRADAVLGVLPAGSGDATAEIDRLRTENSRMRHELQVMYGGAFDSLRHAPADPAAETQPSEPESGAAVDLADGPVRCPLCPNTVTLHTPNGARAHFTTVHPGQQLVGPGPWPLPANQEKPAAETQPDTEAEWCKCRSCWGWFVEEHPGEDLDELGRDLGWWSGLPEHRDAPAGVQTDEEATR